MAKVSSIIAHSRQKTESSTVENLRDLIHLPSKVELRQRVLNLLAQDLAESDRRMLTRFKEFADVEKTTLSMLYSMIKLRLRPLAT